MLPAVHRLHGSSRRWTCSDMAPYLGDVCFHEPAREPGSRRKALITFPKLKSWQVHITLGGCGRAAALHHRAK